MAVEIEKIVSPNEASILSMIAGNPRSGTAPNEAWAGAIARLDSDLAKEIARVLIDESQADQVSEQARETAFAMRDWYRIKRKQRLEQTKREVLTRRRRMIARAMRPGRSGKS